MEKIWSANTCGGNNAKLQILEEKRSWTNSLMNCQMRRNICLGKTQQDKVKKKSTWRSSHFPQWGSAMDDGGQKLLDVINDPHALASFLGGLSTESAQDSDHVGSSVDSIVDSIAQNLIDGHGNESGSSLVVTSQILGTTSSQSGPSVTFTVHQQQTSDASAATSSAHFVITPTTFQSPHVPASIVGGQSFSTTYPTMALTQAQTSPASSLQHAPSPATSPFPTRSPAPAHAPPTPSPSPGVLLRSPAHPPSVQSHVSPNPSPYHQQLQSPLQQQTIIHTRSPAPPSLTPVPSPSPQRAAPSPSHSALQNQLRPSTPTSASIPVIHQALSAGLSLAPITTTATMPQVVQASMQQFPMMAGNSVMSGTPMQQMIQGNQLVQIIQSAPTPQASPIRTQVSIPTPRPKQPQLLPKPAQTLQNQIQTTLGKPIVSGARPVTMGNVPTQAPQLMIGTNPTVIAGQPGQGTLLLNQMIPGLTQNPVILQQPGGGVHLILRPQTPLAGQQQLVGAQKSSQPLVISGATATAGQGQAPTVLIQQPIGAASATMNQTTRQSLQQQQQQVVRLITAGTMQLQQIQTPSGPTFIAVPAGQTLNFQQLTQLRPTAGTVGNGGVSVATSSANQISLPAVSMAGTGSSGIIPSASMIAGGIQHTLGTGTQTVLQQTALPSVIQHNQEPSLGHPPNAVVSEMNTASLTSIGGHNNSNPVFPPVKKKPKKKKKKKKDEEKREETIAKPTLNLAELLKQTGIVDEDDVGVFETLEENQSTCGTISVSQGDVSTNAGMQHQQHQHHAIQQTQTAVVSQSQLLTHLQNPISSQPSPQSQPHVRLSLGEDGRVLLQREAQISSSGNLISLATQSPSPQPSTTSVLLQTLQQGPLIHSLASAAPATHTSQSITTGQSHLPHIISSAARSSPSPSAASQAASHIVLSQLLRSGPHLIHGPTPSTGEAAAQTHPIIPTHLSIGSQFNAGPPALSQMCQPQGGLILNSSTSTPTSFQTVVNQAQQTGIHGLKVGNSAILQQQPLHHHQHQPTMVDSSSSTTPPSPHLTLSHIPTSMARTDVSNASLIHTLHSNTATNLGTGLSVSGAPSSLSGTGVTPMLSASGPVTYTTNSVLITPCAQVSQAVSSPPSAVVATSSLLQCLQHGGIYQVPPLHTQGGGNITKVIPGLTGDTSGDSDNVQQAKTSVITANSQVQAQQSVLLQQLNAAVPRRNSVEASSTSVSSTVPLIPQPVQSLSCVSQTTQTNVSNLVSRLPVTTAEETSVRPTSVAPGFQNTFLESIVQSQIPDLNKAKYKIPQPSKKKKKKPDRERPKLPVIVQSQIGGMSPTLQRTDIVKPVIPEHLKGITTCNQASPSEIISNSNVSSVTTQTFHNSSSVPVSLPSCTPPLIQHNNNIHSGTQTHQLALSMENILPSHTGSQTTSIQPNLDTSTPHLVPIVTTVGCSVATPSVMNSSVATTTMSQVMSPPGTICSDSTGQQTHSQNRTHSNMVLSTQGTAGVVQRVQTIQLTPQKQQYFSATDQLKAVNGPQDGIYHRHLKNVQMQLQAIMAKKQRTAQEQTTFQRLLHEQQKILSTGKLVPTIPGQHAVPFNQVSESNSPPKRTLPKPVPSNIQQNTHLETLLRQPVSGTQSPAIRYYHQVGNQIITFTPQQKTQCQQVRGLSPDIPPQQQVQTQTQQQQTQTQTPTAAQQVSTPVQVSSSSSSPTPSPMQQHIKDHIHLPSQPQTQHHHHVHHQQQQTEHVHQAQQTQQQQIVIAQHQRISCHQQQQTSPQHHSQQSTPQQTFSPIGKVDKMQSTHTPSTVQASTQTPVPTSEASTSPSMPAVVASVPNFTSVLHIHQVGKGISPMPPQAVIAPVTQPSPINRGIKRPAGSPLRPTISKSALIEQQLRTDQAGALNPDCKTPFKNKSDACKRLIRYHVFNEKMLTQSDLEKADEIFEATAKYLLDKCCQMMNKYRYLLLKESMLEVRTSELMMIDRMFVAEEQAALERDKKEEAEKAVKDLESMNVAQGDERVKMEPKFKDEDSSSFSGEIREVRIMVQDVMKNDTIKRELEEDRFTIVKSEPDEKKVKSECDEKYDEWEAIQKELSVYSMGKDSKVDMLPSPIQDVEFEEVKMNSHECGSEVRTSSNIAERVDLISNKSPMWSKDEYTEGSSTLNSDVGINGSLGLGLESSPSPPLLHPSSIVCQSNEQRDLDSSPNMTCGEDDIHAQVQSAIDSILNLQRTEDGSANTVNTSTSFPLLGANSREETQVLPPPVSEFNGEVNHYDDDDDDPALDEAVRSILS